MRLDSQLSRRNRQMISTGFSSGAFGGNGSKLMLAGTSSLAEVCHPAWSNRTTQGHGRAVAEGEHEPGSSSSRRTDSAKDGGRASPLIVRS